MTSRRLHGLAVSAHGNPTRDVGESHAIVPVERIESVILVLRGHRVLLDTDLAAMYDVETRELVQAVKRNIERFPADFMFRLTAVEFDRLRSQSVISKLAGRGGHR